MRLALAAGLQRLQPFQRWAIAAELTARAEDAADSNLALMNWYAVEPLVTYDTARALVWRPRPGFRWCGNSLPDGWPRRPIRRR